MTAVAVKSQLDPQLAGSPYVAYSYAYPHKTAYRPLVPPRDLAEVWQGEDTSSLFLYLHVPFCEFRCGFCNLFTLAQPDDSLPARYLAALRRQAEIVAGTLRVPYFSRLAIGGGTPTFLSVEELDNLLDIPVRVLGVRPRDIPVSCEASPATITAEKLALLRERGVDRLSLGIQSFNEEDAHAMGRPQRCQDVEAALGLVHDAGFPTVNLDLIYGGETQTRESWLDSVVRAADFGADEIYLYPLYVRPLTGLGRRGRSWDDWRLALYRAGRDKLLERGYEQVSMRMFQQSSRHTPCAVADSRHTDPLRGYPGAYYSGPAYCCQDDGMIGLGCGARSYSRGLHYSREYAVGTGAIAGILADYISRSATDFSRVDYGFVLDPDEQRRRVLILSLLQAGGLDLAHYRRRFGANILDDFPQLEHLAEHGLAIIDRASVRLTAAGLERSDAIGPWLYSPQVLQRMEDYAWR
jgi:oxygen-independent coproporphyrinogen-3 oxidase